MVCQICGKKSSFYPLCTEHNRLKAEGKVTKCKDCGIWKEGTYPLCKDCFYLSKKNEEKKSASYKPSEVEVEEKTFRSKFEATFRTEDGHMVRSKAEQSIDNWLYHKRIVHAYERKLPIEEEMYCDFYIPIGNIWIEYWGLDEEKYNKRKELKKTLYEKHEKNLIELFDKDIENLDDVMPKKLTKFSKEFKID
jgi:hypothetical protein